MTQKIEPTYVTFEQAKLLKEKGFDELTTVWRQHGNGISGDVEGKRDYYNRKGDVYVSLPEQWQVIEWLRVNHGIWINIEPEEYGQYYYVKLNVCSQELWEDLDKRHEVITAHRKFNNEHKTPQEAYSAAFDYILNDLI